MENSEKKTVSRIVIDREVIMRKYHVHIKNFRNLKDVKVTLSPLTILTGENGSGKSTLFKALLFLKHNHDHEAAKKLKYVIDDDINLGGWEHIANDPKKPISIKITEETWGYDHEVEEIYDLDNCPFELNPTEEYAEKLWESFKHIRFVNYEKIKVSKCDKKIFKVKNLTKKLESTEFNFSDGRLITTELDKGDGLSFAYHYALPENEEWLKAIDFFVYNFTLNYYVVFDKARYGKLIKPESLFDVLNLVLKCWLETDTQDQEPIENVEFPSPIFTLSSMKEFESINQYLPFLVKILAATEEKEIKLINDILPEIFNETNFDFDYLLNKIQSIGTTRIIPKPYYFVTQLRNEEYYSLYNNLKEYHSLGYDSYDAMEQQFIYHRLKSFLAKLGLGKEIVLEENEIYISPKLVTIKDEKILLSESSSGTLQLLPILFLLNNNPECSHKFFIQQPELHLHPKLQSLIIDFFIEMISPSQEWTGRHMIDIVNRDIRDVFLEKFAPINENIHQVTRKGYRFDRYTVPTHLIIETHSEHLLKKLQVLVSQGKTLQLWPEGYCSGEDVKLKDALSIYYFAKDKNGNTKAIEMELDDNGFFKTETPKGFFDESLELNRQLLLGRN